MSAEVVQFVCSWSGSEEPAGTALSLQQEKHEPMGVKIVTPLQQHHK